MHPKYPKNITTNKYLEFLGRKTITKFIQNLKTNLKKKCCKF